MSHTIRSPVSRAQVLAQCTTARTLQEISARLGRPTNSVHHRLFQLRREGHIQKAGEHDELPLWLITDAGKALMAEPPPDPRTLVRGGARDLLELLASEPGLSAAEAARKLGKNQSGITTVANRLEAKGLIQVGEREYRGRPLLITARGLAEIGGER
jgi:DNA-binding IclR family transcriptional regulator